MLESTWINIGSQTSDVLAIILVKQFSLLWTLIIAHITMAHNRLYTYKSNYYDYYDIRIATKTIRNSSRETPNYIGSFYGNVQSTDCFK